MLVNPDRIPMHITARAIMYSGSDEALECLLGDKTRIEILSTADDKL